MTPNTSARSNDRPDGGRGEQQTAGQDLPLPGGEELLSDRMARAARDLQTQDDPSATYRMATELALTNIDGCHAASLSLVRGNGVAVENFAATDPAAALADELQAQFREGPCLRAIDEASTTYCPALAYDDRWPTWGPQVVEQTGLNSVLSFHLFTHQGTLGALNLYSREKAGFDEEDQHDGMVIAAHISTAFAAAQRIDNLGRAMATRALVGQATGVIMERYQVNADVAFKILARLSSHQERKLRDLASDIVHTGDVPPFPRT